MKSHGHIPFTTQKQTSFRILFFVGILLGMWGITFATYKFGLAAGAVIGLIPAALCALLYTIQRPVYALFGLFVVNYFIMWIGRYLHEVPVGLLLDAMVGYTFLVMMLHAFMGKIQWKNASTWLTLLAFIWLVYGLLQVVNPESISVAGWFSSVRSISFHFFFIVVLTQILLDDIKYLRGIIYLWSVLTLIAVGKALIQKYVGFDQGELYWLFVLGKHSTHIIHSGVRYFSIFSDAANFGGAMGFAMVVFSTMALHVKKKPLKFYLLLVAAVACYGMLISGTRSALAVPFIGYAAYIILSKKIKIILLGTVAVIGIFVFLNYTHIGQGNAIVRRMRSAFNPNDPSLIIRLENQEKLRTLMVDKPFGAGLGHGGGKAKEFAPDAPLSQIPTDSWYVMIWVETGVVGIVMHLMILFAVIGYGSYIVLFKLRDPQLRQAIASLTAGISGVAIMSYGNEILGQIPTGVIIYMSMAFIAMSPRFDARIAQDAKQKTELP